MAECTQAFERLDALRARLHPGHASTRRPPSLDPDASRRMSTLWESIGIWRMREPGLARTGIRPAEPDNVFSRSLSRYFASARSASDEALAWLNPSASAQLIVDAPGFDRGLPGFRVFQPERSKGRPSWQRCAIGQLDGIDVWLQQAYSALELLIRYNPRDEEQLRRSPNERSMSICSEQPMREGYDALGW
ncbi:hypothetical protein WMF31_41765 [Sorangium sp. So ce1036]|uniref:hypothetical protein n=1 Tax=Sorangium sp. So ce1036 TaxID=3133328 RepID=UPI003F12A1CD